MITKKIQNTEKNSISDTIIEVLDTAFLKALTDPTRILIIRKLVSFGVCDVTTIAKNLSQDRSVVSRHLLNLEKAGITISKKIGRQVFHDINGPYVVDRLELILSSLSPMRQLCIPFTENYKD
ncbi:MAG: helix-turn-helix transcriptional regulator [Hellea sp.]|jgi:DNA-binding transcriptional ArsR family regulator|nr:helix-turn-helix transcriptional regulator [Hellea sp.]